MRFAPSIPQRLRTWLTLVASFAKEPTANVTVQLTRDTPHCRRATIYLTAPEVVGYDWEIVGRSFLHELSHARDFLLKLDGDQTREQAESKARAAEHACEVAMMFDLARTYGLPMPEEV